MKKRRFMLAKIGFVMTILLGCGGCGNNGNKSVIGVDGKEYDSYQSACRNQDFVAAYDWIEKNNGSEEDKDYVFNAEMLYLTSLGTEEASNRIVFLLAEYRIPGKVPQIEQGYQVKREDYKPYVDYIEGNVRFNTRCNNVLDLAISQGDEKLAKKITKLYKQDILYHMNGNGYYYVNAFTWDSRDKAQAKLEEAFGKEEVKETDEEKAPSTPKETKKKRRR